MEGTFQRKLVLMATAFLFGFVVLWYVLYSLKHAAAVGEPVRLELKRPLPKAK